MSKNWTPEQRARYYENARKKAAAKALAAGRVPGKKGQPPKNRTPEEKAAMHRERVARYYFENHEKMKRYHREWMREATGKEAEEAGRQPGKIGRPATLTAGEKRARKAARTKKNYHANLERERARAATRARENRAAKKAGTYVPKLQRLTDEARRLAGTAWSAKRRAMKIDAGGSYTAKDIKILRYRQNGICPLCDMNLGQNDIHVDHWVPLAKGGHNGVGNLALTHGACNLRKGIKHPSELGLAAEPLAA